MNGKFKSIAKFLVCAPAFSQRNMTSIGLVVMFLLVYVMAGGKITTSLPKMPSSKAPFGLPSKKSLNKNFSKKSQITNQASKQSSNLSTKESKSVLGEIRSAQRNDIDSKRAKIGSLFTEDERLDLEKEEIDQDGLVKGHKFESRKDRRLKERAMRREKKDSLSAIEERLKSRNHTFLLDQ